MVGLPEFVIYLLLLFFIGFAFVIYLLLQLDDIDKKLRNLMYEIENVKEDNKDD